MEAIIEEGLTRDFGSAYDTIHVQYLMLWDGSRPTFEVPVTELRGVPSFSTSQLDQRVETLRAVDQVVWTEAQQREAAICDASHGARRFALRQTPAYPS